MVEGEEEHKLEALLPQANNSYFNYKPSKIQIKNMYGPLEINNPENAQSFQIKMIGVSMKNVIYAEYTLPNPVNPKLKPQNHMALFTWTLDSLLLPSSDSN